MIIRTEAIVLRSIDYGETSQIVTLFTQEKGKFAVMAKGARRPSSRFGSSLQPMSYSQVVVYFKGSRSVQTLSESSHVRPFHGLTRSLEGLSYGMHVTELVYALMQEEERSPGVFNLLLEVLDRLNRATSRFENIVHYFQLRLATVLGFAPRFDREELQRIPGNGGVLNLETGALRRSDPEDGTNVRRASRKALRAFAIFARADLDAIMRLQLDDRTLAELSRLVEDFLRYHVEEAYPTRGTRIVGSLVGRW